MKRRHWRNVTREWKRDELSILSRDMRQKYKDIERHQVHVSGRDTAIKFSHSLPTTKPIPPVPTHVEHSQSQADADGKYADRNFYFLCLLWEVCGQMFSVFLSMTTTISYMYESIMTCLLAVSRQAQSWAFLWQAFKQTGSGLSWILLASATAIGKWE